jgi:hypothetical protein
MASVLSHLKQAINRSRPKTLVPIRWKPQQSAAIAIKHVVDHFPCGTELRVASASGHHDSQSRQCECAKLFQFLDRVTIADFNGTTISLPIQKIDTLELWFEENIGMAVRRLCERISGYRGRSEEDGENRRKFSASTQKPPRLRLTAFFERHQRGVAGHIYRDDLAPPSAHYVDRQRVHDSSVDVHILAHDDRWQQSGDGDACA